MAWGLDGKTALVAAGTAGMGLAIARALARDGADVSICGRDAVRLGGAEKALSEAGGGRVVAVQADLARAADITEFVRRTEAAFSRIDVAVVNSGGPPPGRFMDVTDEDWERAINANFLSVVRLLRKILPVMPDGGRIVVLQSSAIRSPIPNLVLSNALRRGVEGLVKTLARELGERNILINGVAAGKIDTERVQQIDKARAAQMHQSAQAVRSQNEQSIPLNRYGTPDEFAQYALFLLSPLNTYVTGQTLLVDGGMTNCF